MIQHVTVEPCKRSAAFTAHFDKVGVKCGWYSWYVNAKDVPKDLKEKLGDWANVIDLDGRMTLNSVRKAMEAHESGGY